MKPVAWTGAPWTGLIDAFNHHALAWRAIAQTRPIFSLAVFVLTYGCAVASFLPVALVLTGIGGFLFGGWIATAAAVTGATLGGLVVYGLARGALANRLAKGGRGRGRWAGRILEDAKRGAFGYVLTLRLLPMAPFGLVSLAAGAGRMRLGPYLLATALGIVPECAIYAFAGEALQGIVRRGEHVSWDDLARPQAFAPLFGLALLSITTLALRRRGMRR